MSAHRKHGEQAAADFYPTPAWATAAIAPRVLVALPAKTRDQSIIYDPGAGDGAILKVFAEFGHPKSCLLGCEIRAEAVAACTESGFQVDQDDWLDEASGEWDLTAVSAIVMNRPYGGRTNLAEAFVRKALARLKPGADVWALLRVNWLLDGEATHGRTRWLKAGFTPDVHGLPRRPSFTGNGKADATTYAWMHWRVGRFQDVGQFDLLDL